MGGLEHILEGVVNGQGKAVGFHYEGMPNSKGKVINRSKPNKYGVYEATIEVDGTIKSVKSTMFPKEWTPQNVVDAIQEAYKNKTLKKGNTYEATLSSGMKIEMFIDKKGKIISAYPKY